MHNLVSIITPTFNSAKYIAETIQSVQNQTHINWEMIIVDDCSTDHTIDLIKTFITKDNRIQLHQLASNSGAGVARNLALQKSKGDYIAFLDSDDLWKPEKLEKQLNFMQKNKLPLTFSYFEQIDENGQLLYTTITTPTIVSYKMLYYCNWIGNLTGIYKVAFFGKIPIETAKKRQDWMLWLTLVEKTKKAIPVPESLAYYRVRKNSISSSKFSLIKHNYYIYKSFHKNNTFIAILNTILFLFNQLMIKSRFKIQTKA